MSSRLPASSSSCCLVAKYTKLIRIRVKSRHGHIPEAHVDKLPRIVLTPDHQPVFVGHIGTCRCWRPQAIASASAHKGSGRYNRSLSLAIIYPSPEPMHPNDLRVTYSLNTVPHPTALPGVATGRRCHFKFLRRLLNSLKHPPFRKRSLIAHYIDTAPHGCCPSFSQEVHSVQST